MEHYYEILHQVRLPVNSFTVTVSLLIMLFIVSIIVFLILLPYKKFRSERKESFQNKTISQIEETLYAWTDNEKPFETIAENLQTILQDPRTIVLMLEVFNHFAESFKGNTLDELKDLFYATKLKDHAIAKLKSGSNYEKILALRILVNLKIVEAESIILHHSYKNNPLLRSESLVAIAELKQSDMAASLANFQKPVSDWDQLLIIETLKVIGPPETKTILAWLNSENKDVIVLGIRVVYNFNQFDLLDYVVKLLDHSSPKVRWVVLNTLRMHGGDGYEEKMVKFLDQADTDEKISTLHILTAHPESVNKQKLLSLLQTGNPLVQYTALNLLHIKNAVPEKDLLNEAQQEMAKVLAK
jgi:hypothetical protein